MAVTGGGGGSTDGGTDPGVRYPPVDFGGLPKKNNPPRDISTIVCEDAELITIPDPGWGIDPYPGVGVVRPELGNAPPFEGIGVEPDPTPRFEFPPPPGYTTRPDGNGGEAIPVSLPSDNEICAKNFIDGTPNQVVIVGRGNKYFYNNHAIPEYAFPSVFIPGYKGQPVPVVDKKSGELVALLTSCKSWNPNNPGAPVTIIPDENPTGITTDDPDYDTIIGGFFIGNTGKEYCDPVITVYDLDSRTNSAAEVIPVVIDGRIVDIQIINNGTGFKRIPRITIVDSGEKCGTRGGYGAQIYPIMSLIAKPDAKEAPGGVQMVYCPATNQKNLLDPVKNPTAMLTSALEATVASITNPF